MIHLIRDKCATCIAHLNGGFIKGERTKNTLSKLFYIHELQKNGEINVQQICSSGNVTDLFIKSPPIATFKKMVHKIEMQKFIDVLVRGSKYALYSFSLSRFCPTGIFLLRAAGIRCPTPILLRLHVLVIEFIAPKYWCCQVCDKDKGVMSSLLGRENEFSEGSMLHASGKIHQSTTPPSKHNKFPGCCGINWEKKVKTGKTKYLSVEEALSLPSSLNKYGNPLNMTGSSRVVAHPCDPALAHSWKGSFDIIGAPKFAPGVLNNCIHAYPPSRVRRKVYEFSRLLPDTLKFKLVSRGVIWNDLFNNHFPGKDDIGLSEIYIALVEFMRNKDLVMKTLINDVELLVLASTALCMTVMMVAIDSSGGGGDVTLLDVSSLRCWLCWLKHEWMMVDDVLVLAGDVIC
ncbi:putative dnaJ -like protein subfamily C member 21-like [Capsicum annuum]|nr:putative dnaJ -like protein subfamily C member 21-like [Capsicum annuum]